MMNVKSEKKSNKSTTNKFKRVFNIIEYIIIVLVLICSATLIIESAIEPKKTPDLFGKKAFVIISGSMIPTIQIGDVVVLNSDNNAKINDIIGFKNNSPIVVVHRAIDKRYVNDEIMYQTKGDNNNIPDTELVNKKDIEGIFIFKIPVIGKGLLFLYNNLSLVVVVLVVILLIRIFI